MIITVYLTVYILQLAEGSKVLEIKCLIRGST